VGVRSSKASNKDVVIIGTTAGSVGMLVTLDEKVYRRLALLQQLMVTVVPTTFGLNPREYRQMKHRAFKAETKHGVLDGVLLASYICMDTPLQDELSAAMGIDTPLLLETLRDINASGSVF
jgi:cleavage and polyadenylation specificity factor subunit 1